MVWVILPLDFAVGMEFESFLHCSFKPSGPMAPWHGRALVIFTIRSIAVPPAGESGRLACGLYQEVPSEDGFF
jgi:hypothetical protein